MDQRLRILYVTHEMNPYLELTDMADISRELPQHMQEKGYEVRAFMPRFGIIKERKHRLHEVIRLSGMNITVGEDDNPLIIKVASLPSAKMQIYFLDNEDYFHRKKVFHDDAGKFLADNDERMIFFTKGVVEIIMKLGWIPDIVHCMGWMSSLVPFFARTVSKYEPVFKNTRFVFNIYGDGFDGTLGKDFLEKARVEGHKPEHVQFLDNPSCNDLYMTGVTFADGVVLGTTDVDKGVLNHITTLDKPILSNTEASAESYLENYYDFYQTLLGESILEGKS